jgi:hypothetical protein
VQWNRLHVIINKISQVVATFPYRQLFVEEASSELSVGIQGVSSLRGADADKSNAEIVRNEAKML